jgi:uncharacterized membrane protein YeaQ/YmgE (transglycosylase-associated protein family)
MLMGFICWIVLGLIAGFLASLFVNGRGQGITLDVVLGVVGAVIGGWIFNTFGSAGMTGFNFRSLIVAVVGAMVFLIVWHAFESRSSHA